MISTKRAAHPYYPLNAKIPGYLPNRHSLLFLLSAFAATCAVVLSATIWATKILNPRIRSIDLSIVLWFVLSGCIHIFFEGYLVFNLYEIGGLGSIRGELWKEYALSDSRYLTLDTFVVSIEALTVVLEGPFCLFTAFWTAKSSPAQYPLQIIMSVMHMYGATLYYLTALFDATVKGIYHSRPEAYYFWGYCVFLNLPWLVIPGLIIWRSFRTICTGLTRSVEAEPQFSEDSVNASIKKCK